MPVVGRSAYQASVLKVLARVGAPAHPECLQALESPPEVPETLASRSLHTTCTTAS